MLLTRNRRQLEGASECLVFYKPETPGKKELDAEYAGDAEHLAAPITPELVEVSARPTSVAVECPGVAVLAETTCTVTVKDAAAGERSPPAGP